MTFDEFCTKWNVAGNERHLLRIYLVSLRTQSTLEATMKAEIEALKESRAAIVDQEQISRNEANRLRGLVKELVRERDELQAWKDAQLQVESEWNPQDVAKALGLPVGSKIRKSILPAIVQLLKERDEAQAKAEGWKAQFQSRDADLQHAKQAVNEAQAKCAEKFPDIGRDPLQLSGDERKQRGCIEAVREALNAPVCLQQKGVPDQTALVWRIDLSRLLDDHTVLAARWEKLKPALEKAEAKCAEMQDSLRRVSERSWFQDKMQKEHEHVKRALSGDYGKGWRSPEQFAEDLKPTMAILETIMRCDDPYDCESIAQRELARLETLIEKSQR